MKWLYECVNRVPEISDEQIAEMRHIHPVLRVGTGSMFRSIAGSENIHARNVSFLWDAAPTGGEFTFDVLNMPTIITQHKSIIFFKPSLAEVYSWILIQLGDEWRSVSHFCVGEPQRIAGSHDVFCQTVVMSGRKLVKGKLVGTDAYELIEEGVR